MLNTIKIPMILLVLTLLIPLASTQSYAWDHGHQGHSGGGGYHGHGGRGYGNFGFVYNYSPYYYPYYYDTGVLESTPIVEMPEVVVQPPTTVVENTPNYPTAEITPVQVNTTDTDNEITINIPNSKGGYTSVLLKRSGNGYVGPQGEFYTEFPRVSVLHVIYGN